MITAKDCIDLQVEYFRTRAQDMPPEIRADIVLGMLFGALRALRHRRTQAAKDARRIICEAGQRVLRAAYEEEFERRATFWGGPRRVSTKSFRSPIKLS